MVLYGMEWHGVVWYGMVWYGMVWYGMVWYGIVGIVWYGMVWYGMVWCRQESIGNFSQTIDLIRIAYAVTYFNILVTFKH